MWTAIWVFISALAIALIAPMVAHTIKLAEFRQTWINDLRKDIADYIGLCRKWMRTYDDSDDNLYGFEMSDKKQKSKDMFSIANDALVVLWRIKMRINPRENRYKLQDDQLIEALGDLLNPGKLTPTGSDLEAAWRKRAESAVDQSREVLKREWEVTKQLPPEWLSYLLLKFKCWTFCVFQKLRRKISDLRSF